jgi:hypothetical protein
MGKHHKNHHKGKINCCQMSNIGPMPVWMVGTFFEEFKLQAGFGVTPTIPCKVLPNVSLVVGMIVRIATPKLVGYYEITAVTTDSSNSETALRSLNTYHPTQIDVPAGTQVFLV